MKGDFGTASAGAAETGNPPHPIKKKNIVIINSKFFLYNRF